jgi:hypothetical protein
MAVEPRLSTRDDKEVAHRDVIVLHSAQNNLKSHSSPRPLSARWSSRRRQPRP